MIISGDDTGIFLTGDCTVCSTANGLAGDVADLIEGVVAVGFGSIGAF